MNNKELTSIDISVGVAMQERRISLGLSRHNLADKIGITHQQLQKYEKGINRISVGRFYDICKALNIKNFDELLDSSDIVERHHDRLTLEVTRGLQKLDRKQQEIIAELVRSLGE